jgi:hypothetical protein
MAFSAALGASKFGADFARKLFGETCRILALCMGRRWNIRRANGGVMVLSENLLGVAQNFATPDVIQKFSEVLGEPAEKIRTGLKAVIPALLMGIVTKGSTPEGAQRLAQLAQQTPTPTTDINPAAIDSGTQAADQIFDGNLNSTISKLGASTGLSSLSVSKMMGLATPILLVVLVSKISK